MNYLTAIFAHRGASKYAPENTMPAFELAHKMNADGIETDVQLSKDHVPILIHDETGKRTTDFPGLIKDLTYRQIKELDAGTWFSKQFAGTSIVSLEEFLQWIENKPMRINIELKNNKIDYPHMEAIVFEMVKHFRLLERTTFSSFNERSVKKLVRLSHDMDVAFITSKKIKQLAHYTEQLGANAVHIKYRLLQAKLVDELRQKKLAVRVYTVNKQSLMKKCFQLGSDGIFTDVPDIAVHYHKQFFKS
nr:glycerophosphodiester phosphodiesterase [Compostibacillus humi]